MEPLSDIAIDRIVKEINNNMVVPVIGPNVFYFMRDDKPLSVQEWVVLRLFETVYGNECTSEELEEFSNGYKGISHLEKYHKKHIDNNPLKDLDPLRSYILEIFKSTDFTQGLQIDQNIYDLLLNGHFPLILTTCCFAWLKKYPITCNQTAYEQVIYKRGQVKEQDITICDNWNIAKPTIFHMFGLLKGVSDNECVLEEDEFLSFLHCLHDELSRPQNVCDYVGGTKNSPSRYVLAMGCTIPDWTFRFLLYSLKGEGYKYKSADRGGNRFLGGFFDKCISDDIEEFLQYLSYSYSDKPESLEKIAKKLPPLEGKPNIFLSLCHEEYETIGKELERKLSSKFVVWTFHKDGNPLQHWGSIREGLEKCKFIIPVITSKTIGRMRQYKNETRNDKNPGVCEEWERAIENGNLCCPLYAKNLDKQILQNALEANPAANSSFYQFFFPRGDGAAGLCFEKPDFTADTLYNHLAKTLKEESS